MGIILAGDRSGTGKTTLTLALLAALKNRRCRIQSFKVGPDYIDPMFHAAVTGRPCYSLDPVLTHESYVQRSFQSHCSNADYAVIEGVMGLFDGATGHDDTASTAHVARLLRLPVVLAVDCGRMSRSLAALVQGYRHFDPQVNVAGVILNRVGSDRHLQLLQEALDGINMPIVGVFRREKDIQLPDRHLGLVPTGEVSGFDKIVERLAVLGERCFDWERLEGLLNQGPGKTGPGKTGPEKIGPGKIGPGKIGPGKIGKKGKGTADRGQGVRIAIARDQAFNFYYPDNFEALEAQGAELVYWSPLKDEKLPQADGLYFGGGFPEVFAAELSANQPMMVAVCRAIERGMPTYAECGGLMYLSRMIVDFEGGAWPMVGVIPQSVKMGEKLVLGYRKAIALADGPLLKKGQAVVGHEFHKSTVVEALTRPMYQTQRYWGALEPKAVEGYHRANLQASYVHVNWCDRPDIVHRFIQQCRVSLNHEAWIMKPES
ncbi:MAG: cobyrinate a,c-diamide synthase [Phormidesmis sp. RL_2_1]|nr:cobyrinate a,c-diamide synthase [Phormidesmis sp. RL_2_1]